MRSLIEKLTELADESAPVPHHLVEALDDLADSVDEVAEAIESGGDTETAAALRHLINDTEE